MKSKISRFSDENLSEELTKALDSQVSDESVSRRVLGTIRGEQDGPKSPERLRLCLGFLVATVAVVIVTVTICNRGTPLPVEVLAGDALILLDGQERNIAEGAVELTEGSVLATNNSQIRIALGQQVCVILDRGTRVEYLSEGRLGFEEGRIFYRHDSASEQEWTIRTPYGLVKPVGTALEAVARDELVVTVFAGAVEITTANSEAMRVKSGQACRVAGTGRGERVPAPADQRPWWPVSPAVPWTQYPSRY